MTPFTVEDHAKDMAVRLFHAAQTANDQTGWRRFNTFMRNLGEADNDLWTSVLYHLSWVIDGVTWVNGELIHKRFDGEPMPTLPRARCT